MTTLTSTRLARPAVALTTFAVLYAAASAATGWEPDIGWLLQAVIHVGELLVVLALAASGVAGNGLMGRLGLGAAVVGQAVLAVAEVVYPQDHVLGDAGFSLGPLLTGLGLVAAGTAVLRARRWTGWRRLLPLAVGAYVFVALVPAMVATGGPPAVLSLVAIGGWDVLWGLTALAVAAESAAAPVPIASAAA
jgi:hypothetical protein